jgi:DNA repair exonuclease SbcCD nuclease subunit
MHIDLGSYTRNPVVIKLEHDKVNFVFSTDQHLSSIPPGRRADDYQEAILGKMRFQSDLAHKLKGVCLGGGDVFHHKKPRAQGNSLGLIEATAKLLKSFPLSKMFGAVGNHDLSWDSSDSLPHQPLGILIASGLYHDLTRVPVIFTNKEESVCVLVESFPYMSEADLLATLRINPSRPGGVDYRVGILHAYGHPKPDEATFGTSGIPYNPIGYSQLEDLDYDFVCWGHDHSRKETVTVGNATHVHLGSLARAALNMDEVDRPVSLALLSFSEKGMAYKELPIPVKPLEVIFTMADKGMEKVGNKTGEMSAFFSVMDDAVEGITSSDPKQVLKELCPPEEPKLYDRAVEVCEL